MAADLKQLLAYCEANKRVCPQPQRWNELYKILPDTKHKGVGFEPAAPLILAAWWEATDAQKKERVKIHIRWAAEHNALEQVDSFLRLLPESEWHHE